MSVHTAVGASRASAINRTGGAFRAAVPLRSRVIPVGPLSSLARGTVRGTADIVRTSFRRLGWMRARRAAIAKYFRTHAVRKLHLGCGPVLLDGWLNADLRPRTPRHVFLDVTEQFPFPDRSVDYIFTEHLLGDLTYPQAGTMLAECRRVLKPGGRIRVATPSLAKLAELYLPGRNEAHERYVSWAIQEFVGWADAPLPGLVINNLFQEHPFVYDPATLQHVLARAGFVDIVEQQYGRSDDPVFDGIDSHGGVLGRPEISGFETVTMEALRG